MDQFRIFERLERIINQNGAFLKAVILLTMITSTSIGGYVYPGDECCRLWDLDDYADESPSVLLCLDGQSEMSFTLSTEGLYDDVNSYACGKNVAFDFCLNS